MVYKSETGRSMVEILGVLSVIGVLSVGGMYGYHVLHQKHLNNQRVYETSLRAFAVSSQMLADREPTLEEFPVSVLGHQIHLTSSPSAFEATASLSETEEDDPKTFDEGLPYSTDNTFALEMTNVSSDVCQFFVQMASSKSVIKQVVNSSGKDITSEDCQSFQATSSSVNSTSSTVSSDNSSTLYLVYNRDMSVTDIKDVKDILGDTVCNGHGQVDAVDALSGCLCEVGWSGADCVKENEACNGHGQWFYNKYTQTSRCVCEEGYTGSYCNEEYGYSPCQTYKTEDGKEVREFKPINTPCESAGMEGRCNAYGKCVVKGYACSAKDGCPERQFCNYGGHMGDYQDGGTPDVCEMVSSETYETMGATYYYNTIKDLRSWCRPADGQANCTWGFLAHEGAESWCSSLGARLLTNAEFNGMPNELRSKLPVVMGDCQMYWIADGAKSSCDKTGTTYDKGRFDGYVNKGGVLCIKDNENPLLSCPSSGINVTSIFEENGQCRGGDDFASVVCPKGKEIACSGNGHCICYNTGENVKCNGNNCIACSNGKIAECSIVGECFCFGLGETVECNSYYCTSCSDGKIAKCPESDGNCICYNEGENVQCNLDHCIVCPNDQIAECKDGEECRCVFSGLTAEEKDFLDDMIEVAEILKDFDKNLENWDALVHDAINLLAEIKVYADTVSDLSSALSDTKNANFMDALGTLREQKDKYMLQEFEKRIRKEKETLKSTLILAFDLFNEIFGIKTAYAGVGDEVLDLWNAVNNASRGAKARCGLNGGTWVNGYCCRYSGTAQEKCICQHKGDGSVWIS